MKPMKQEHAEVIIALAECGMNMSEVARRLHWHRNTILYRIRQIFKTYGKNPLDFYDLSDLLQIARETLQES